MKEKEKLIRQVCSSRGCVVYYTKKEWKGRENMVCPKCKGWLSPASGWWLGDKELKEIEMIAKNG